MNHSHNRRRIVLHRRPQGLPRVADFRLESSPVPALEPGDMLIANRFLSMDPAIRGFLDDRPSYLPPVALGETVRGMSLGRVLRSRHDAIKEGTYVRALTGWEELSIVRADALGLEVVSPEADTPLQYYMGGLGPAGLTAWVGLHEIAHIKAGQTVLISAAVGAVGSIAGQIARLRGCRVVGLTSSPAKMQHLAELGFDAAIDYRAEPDLSAAMKRTCPQGIDVYFDNVGGATLEAVLPLMSNHGTVVVCGMVSEYNQQEQPYAVRTLWQLVVKRMTMRGFLTYEHPECLPAAQRQLTEWLHNGDLKILDNVHEGIDSAPTAFIELMSGKTIGKTLVHLPEAVSTTIHEEHGQ